MRSVSSSAVLAGAVLVGALSLGSALMLGACTAPRSAADEKTAEEARVHTAAEAWLRALFPEVEGEITLPRRGRPHHGNDREAALVHRHGR